jgi:hypothetical protein
MKFLMRGYSNNENYNADIDYVWVDVGPELAKTILRRRKLFLKANEEEKKAEGRDWGNPLWEMYFGDHHARYFQYGVPPDEETEKVDQGEAAQTDWDPGDNDGERTECDQMVITEDGVRWTTIPKHCEIYITSETIPYSKIEECLW